MKKFIIWFLLVVFPSSVFAQDFVCALQEQHEVRFKSTVPENGLEIYTNSANDFYGNEPISLMSLPKYFVMNGSRIDKFLHSYEEMNIQPLTHFGEYSWHVYFAYLTDADGDGLSDEQTFDMHFDFKDKNKQTLLITENLSEYYFSHVTRKVINYVFECVHADG
jgi:hypothetical protein